MADTLRKGGAPGSNQDRTDPELVIPTNPSAVLSPKTPDVKPPPPVPPGAAGPLLPAPTQILGVSHSKPIDLLARPVGHGPDDPTSMATRSPRPVQRAQPGPPRGEPSVVAPDAERPKVWVATHKAPPDPDPRLILVREPDSARAASFRVLRHRITERGDPRVIAVTSASPRDGKTTCAANLALALSEFGRAKVLLLEANLRVPQVAVLFGFLPPECFSVQLQRHRERPLDPWSVVEAFSPALHVLAVKPGETNRPLLDAPAMSIAIEMLVRVGYDYIVIDTPSVLGSADVNLIEDYVDGVLLTARSGRTMGRALRAAIEQLSPRKLLGVTLLDA